MSARGDVAIKLGSKMYRIRFDMAALDRLRVHFGSNYDDILTEATVNKDLKPLCEAMAIGLIANHKDEVSADDIYEASPPLIPFINKLHAALNVGMSGNEEGPVERPTRANRIKWAWKILFAKANETPFALE